MWRDMVWVPGPPNSSVDTMRASDGGSGGGGGGYYGVSFSSEKGLTQGEPLLPNIFNVVVDAVVCHWE